MRINWRKIIVSGALAGMVIVTGCAGGPEMNHGNRNGERLGTNATAADVRESDGVTRGMTRGTHRGLNRANNAGHRAARNLDNYNYDGMLNNRTTAPRTRQTSNFNDGVGNTNTLYIDKTVTTEKKNNNQQRMPRIRVQQPAVPRALTNQNQNRSVNRILNADQTPNAGLLLETPSQRV